MNTNVQAKKNNKYFIKTLNQILKNEEYHSIIQLNEHRNGFIILNREQLIYVISQHFNHNNIESFRRQLNHYGFESKRTKLGQIEYYNLEYDPDHEIQRKLVKTIAEDENQIDQSLLQQYKEVKIMQEKQQMMFNEIKKIKVQQHLLAQNLLQQIKLYIKCRIQGEFRKNTLQKFCTLFYNGIKEGNFKKYIRINFYNALFIAQEAYANDYFLRKCQHYAPALISPNQSLLDNLMKLEFYQKQESPIWQSICEESYQERSSNVSNYLNL